MATVTHYGPGPSGETLHKGPRDTCTYPDCADHPADTHPGLGPDGQPATHRGLQGLCPAPECRASGAIALALTVQQPWADAIAQDPEPYRTAKRTENRSWPIPPKHLGARILLHAAKEDDPTAVLARGSNWPDQRGVVLAVARITACHQPNARGPLCCAPWGFPAVPGQSMWHWDLTDVKRLPQPIEARGAQKLWRPTLGLVAAVRAQVDTTVQS